MKKAYIAAFAALISTHSFAQDVPIHQAGVVCNTLPAAQAFYVAKADAVGSAHTDRQLVRQISNPTDWCIVGRIKRSRSSHAVEGILPAIYDAIENRDRERNAATLIELAGSFSGPTAAVANLFGFVIRLSADRPLPAWTMRTYNTESSNNMFFFSLVE